MLAKLGGFLGREGDGNPGAIPVRRGLARLVDITDTPSVFYPLIPTGP